jgi:hypothetical protein
MNRTFSVILLGAIALAGACKDDTARQADLAAHQLTKSDDRLRAAQAKLDDHTEDVSRAADVFAVRRKTRIDALAAEQGVIATQPMIVQMLSDALPLTELGRSQVNEKLTVFEMRLDDSAHAIEALETVPASEFTARDDAMTKQMSRLDDARKDTWKALDTAPRLDRTSSL